MESRIHPMPVNAWHLLLLAWVVAAGIVGHMVYQHELAADRQIAQLGAEMHLTRIRQELHTVWAQVGSSARLEGTMTELGVRPRAAPSAPYLLAVDHAERMLGGSDPVSRGWVPAPACGAALPDLHTRIGRDGRAALACPCDTGSAGQVCLWTLAASEPDTIAVLDATALFSHLWQGARGGRPTRLAVATQSPALARTVVYDSGGGATGAADCVINCGGNAVTHQLDDAGQSWELNFQQQTPGLLGGHGASFSVALLGVLALTAGSALLWRMRREVRRLQRIAVQRRRYFADMRGRHEQENRALRRSREELLRARNQLRLLAQAHLATKVEERKRIAREIHDDLGQCLLALKTDLTMLASGRAPSDAEHWRAVLDETEHAFGSMRAIVNDLRPAVLELGLALALRWEADKFRRVSGVPCEIELLDVPPELNDEIALALYRVVQEALTNVHKHARATRARLAAWHKSGWLFAVVADDGAGVAHDSTKGRYGIIGMTERATALGGTFDIDSAPGGGTKVLVSIPLKGPGAPAPEHAQE